jgi:hypothetical protein
MNQQNEKKQTENTLDLQGMAVPQGTTEAINEVEATEPQPAPETKKKKGKELTVAMPEPVQPILKPEPIDEQILRMAERISGAGVEALKELFALRERIVNEHARRQFYEALRQVQAELKPVPKKRIVKNKDGSIRYRYATFDDVVETIRPILVKHGFSFSFKTNIGDNKAMIRCELYHKDGHTETCEVTMPLIPDASGMNIVQSFGAVITYGKRYALSLLLGIPSEEDTDGNPDVTIQNEKIIIEDKPQNPMPVQSKEVTTDEKETVERLKLRIEVAEALKKKYPTKHTKEREDIWHAFLLEKFGVASSKALTLEQLRLAVRLLKTELDETTYETYTSKNEKGDSATATNGDENLPF